MAPMQPKCSGTISSPSLELEHALAWRGRCPGWRPRRPGRRPGVSICCAGADGALEVAGQGEAQAGDDVVHRAWPSAAGGSCRSWRRRCSGRRRAAGVSDFEGQLAELLDGEAQAGGLLVEEASRCRRRRWCSWRSRRSARCRRPSGLQEDQLGVLAADLDDRADLGVEVMAAQSPGR